MSDATVFVSLAFAIVWMKRKNRWKLFFQALEGKAALAGTAAAGGQIPGGTGTVTSTSSTPSPTQPIAKPPTTGGQTAF